MKGTAPKFISARYCRKKKSRSFICRTNSDRRLSVLVCRSVCYDAAASGRRFSLYIHVTVHRNRFLFNNQPDALNLFCYKTLHVSGIFSAHHQEFCTVHSALVSFMQVSDNRLQAESGWNCSAVIIPILSCYKTLHVSGIFSAHHQEFSTVHSALVSFMRIFDDHLQAESGWNCSSILTLLGNGHQKPA